MAFEISHLICRSEIVNVDKQKILALAQVKRYRFYGIQGYLIFHIKVWNISKVAIYEKEYIGITKFQTSCDSFCNSHRFDRYGCAGFGICVSSGLRCHIPLKFIPVFTAFLFRYHYYKSGFESGECNPVIAAHVFQQCTGFSHQRQGIYSL